MDGAPSRTMTSLFGKQKNITIFTVSRDSFDT